MNEFGRPFCLEQLVVPPFHVWLLHFLEIAFFILSYCPCHRYNGNLRNQIICRENDEDDDDSYDCVPPDDGIEDVYFRSSSS
jgi:hypothetical protein